LIEQDSSTSRLAQMGGMRAAAPSILSMNGYQTLQ
jgi:hypothetical protein